MDRGGGYLVLVKENRPTLYKDIALLFSDPPPGEQFGIAEQKGQHGDRYEVRKLWTSAAMEGYLDWPYARQVCKLQREVEQKGKKTAEMRYIVTSLQPEKADVARLLGLRRGHWGMERRRLVI